MIKGKVTKLVTCRYCGSDTIVKFGRYHGIQRYFCKVCLRKLRTGSYAFYMGTPADVISCALVEYYNGHSINNIRGTIFQKYHYSPSSSVVWKWVNKYSNLAIINFADCHPRVGNIWTADETVVDQGGYGHIIWTYNVIDEETKFLLASCVSLTKTTNNAKTVLKEAQKRAEKIPNQVLAYADSSYKDGIKLAFGADAEHIQYKPLNSGENLEKIVKHFGSHTDRIKVMLAIRNIKNLIRFNNLWVVYYNYFKPQQSLCGKTPAEVAGIQYTIHNWIDLVHLPLSNEAKVKSHAIPIINQKRKQLLTI